MNDQQNNVYQTILQAVSDNSGGLYFVDVPVGTGKTFIITLIMATIQLQKKISLTLASSGVAATLLDRGRISHSALKLPLEIQVSEIPTCNI